MDAPGPADERLASMCEAYPPFHTTIGRMTRVKVSVTVDPDVLHEVDNYVGEHQGLDRSKVVDEALALWLARRQDAAMEEQFSGESAPPGEVEAWRSVRRAAAAQRLQRP